MEDVQQAKKLDVVTLRKMGVSALLLAAGAVLSYVADNLLKILGAAGIPAEYQPVALAVCTWLVNAGREWLKGEEYI